MKIAVISDVHANLEALDAVLADSKEQQTEMLWCLGDIVGYGADPNPVVERLAKQCDATVAGNHDWAACGKMELGYFNAAAAEAARWTADALTAKSKQWLDGLPLERVERGVRLVHASPSDPAAWLYVLSIGEASGEMSTFDENLCFIGHSHFPGNFEQQGDQLGYSRDGYVECRRDRRYLINVGSVGQPRDGDPRAAYVVFDPGTMEIWHRRVAYDIDGAHRKIIEAGLPPFLADRLLQGA